MNFGFYVYGEMKSCSLPVLRCFAFRRRAAAANDGDVALADHAEIDCKHLAAESYCSWRCFGTAGHIRIVTAADRISNFFFCYGLKISNVLLIQF